MIKQDNGKCTIEGNPGLLINETARLVLNVALSVSENTGVSEEDVLAHIQQAIQMDILIESGMSIEEAIKIADPTHKITEVRTVREEEDGSTTVLKEYNHE